MAISIITGYGYYTTARAAFARRFTKPLHILFPEAHRNFLAKIFRKAVDKG